MSPHRGRPFDQEKHREIIQAALNLIDSGAPLSVAAVARAAHVARATIYNHFGSLAKLEIIVLFKKSTELLKESDASVSQSLPFRDRLIETGRLIAQSMLNSKFKELAQVIAIKSVRARYLDTLETNKDVEDVEAIVEMFYDEYMAVMHQKVRTVLESGVKKREIDLSELMLDEAVEHLLAMWQSSRAIGIALEITSAPGQKHLEQHISSAVDFFLKAYQTPLCAV